MGGRVAISVRLTSRPDVRCEHATRSSAARPGAGAALDVLLPPPPRPRLGALLAGPVGWLVVGYLGSLAVMLRVGVLVPRPVHPSEVVCEPTLDDSGGSSRSRFTATSPARTVRWRRWSPSPDAVIAFPIAFTWRAWLRPGRVALVVAIVIPLMGELPGQGLHLAHDPGGRLGSWTGCSLRWGIEGPGYSARRHMARVHIPVAAVHDRARSTRVWSGSRPTRPCSKRRPTSARGSDMTSLPRPCCTMAFPSGDRRAGSSPFSRSRFGDYVKPPEVALADGSVQRGRGLRGDISVSRTTFRSPRPPRACSRRGGQDLPCTSPKRPSGRSRAC